MAAAIDEDMMASDLADHLVVQGVPFRQAHEVVGRWVRLGLEQGRGLHSFTLDELRALHPAFTAEVYACLDPAHSIARRTAIGGSAPAAVAEQLAKARRAIERKPMDSRPSETLKGAGGSS
jgi:argininosuccinate lyase